MRVQRLMIQSLMAALVLAPAVQAALTITNGDFESNATQTTDVTGWFDTTATEDAWWQATWAGPSASPNGGPVLGLSYMNSALNWAYQSIGVNDTAITNLAIQYDVGSFTDAGEARDLGLVFSVYESDGSFSGANDSDIAGASGVTLVDSITVYSGALSAGELLTDQSVSLDLRSAATDRELFLRIQNVAGSTGGPWAAVDNIVLFEGTNSPAPEAADPYTAVHVQAEAFGLDRVRLLDSRFKEIQELHRTGYLEWLDLDRLLSPFRSNAGLSTQGAADLGGWEDSSSGFTRGHMAGHYLSGAAKMYASTGDSNYLAKMEYLVEQLKLCQNALANSEPVYGYLSAFPSSWFDGLETNPHGWNNVPFYTIHKILAGLVDTYKYGGLDEALDIAIDMSDYHRYRVDQLSDSQIEAMFQTYDGNSEEWGGMNETLTEIYLLSNARGDANAVRHLDFARIFDRDWFVEPLFNHIDILATGPDSSGYMHANTHVPQVVGFAHVASVLNSNDTERARLYTASENFWHMVTEEHSFCIGGNSYAEHFHPPGEEAGAGGSSLAWNTAETCNTYNMLKLTGELMQHRPSVDYADYYERALYNHILASTSPETGMATYFMSLQPGHFKTYSQAEGSCWCCTGSGLENPSQYGQYIYLHNEETLWVNLYIPSTLDWSEQGIQLTMETDYPNADTIQFTLNCDTPVQVALRLRIPAWIAAPASIAVNGTAQAVSASAGSYAELDRTWSDGDVITLTLPMNLHLDRAIDDESQVSVFYGPVLLAGDLGTENLPDNHQEAVDQWDLSGYTDPSVPSLMASDAGDLTGWVHSTSTALVFTADAALAGATNRSAVVLKPFYDTHHTRYSVYWNLIAPAEFSDWDGSGSATGWSDSNNWDRAPEAGSGLRFSAPEGGTTENDTAVDTVYSGIDFPVGAGAFVLEGNRIGLQGDVVNASGAAQTVNLSMVLQDGLPWYFNASGADLILGGGLSGNGVLVKQGANNVVLQGVSDFEGSVYVSAGNLVVGAGGSLGAVPVMLSTNTALVLDRSDDFDFSAAVSGAGTVIKRGAGTMNLSAALDMRQLRVEEGTVLLGSSEQQILAHRWSFNGDLSDSVGGATAEMVEVGSNDASLTPSYVALSGGNKYASDYVELGADLLPKDGGPFTLEMWATPLAVHNWSRIFDVGTSTTENLFMSWTRDSSDTDRVEWYDGETVTVNDSCAPYLLNTEYHIVMVVEPEGGATGGTRVAWYAAPAADAELGAAKGSMETDNTPAELNADEFCLGRSQYGDETAEARYNEVRLWNYALTENQLEQLHDLGPNELGGIDAVTLSGSISSNLTVNIQSGAKLDLGDSVSVVLNGDAVIAGTLSGSGTVETGGSLLLIGDASVSSNIVLTSRGVLDTICWNGTLPTGWVNEGTVIDRSMVQLELDVSGSNLVLQAPGYTGHNYQFQNSTNLLAPWCDAGPVQEGEGGTLQLEQVLNGSALYFRLLVQP